MSDDTRESFYHKKEQLEADISEKSEKLKQLIIERAKIKTNLYDTPIYEKDIEKYGNLTEEIKDVEKIIEDAKEGLESVRMDGLMKGYNPYYIKL